MKNSIYYSVMVFAFMLFAGNVSAQKVKVTKGDLKFLSSVKSINLEFDYSETTVGKYKKESEYVNNKTKEMNKKKKGSGDKWATGWVSDREERFEPKFQELINDKLSKAGVKVEKGLDAKYTMLVKTTHTEPGFNVGVMRRPAHINVEIDVLDADGKRKCTMVIEKIPGQDAMGYDFDTGLRLQEAYAKGGKTVGAHLAKKVYK